MGEHTNIAWTTHTFNPWVGCQAVSPACDHCYAEARARRFGDDFAERRRTSARNWQQPLRWNAAAAAAGVRATVFAPSLGDPFDNRVPEPWRVDLWHRIAETPHLDWLLLTKRPQNIRHMLPTQVAGHPRWGAGWDNVSFGITAENQDEYDRRWHWLARTPVRRRFLSCEPLLERLDLHSDECRTSGSARECPVCFGGIDWVIAGGESGPGARPTQLQWVRDLHDQARMGGAAFFMKQAGSARGGDWPADITGKGDDPAQWPEDLRVQEVMAAC